MAQLEVEVYPLTILPHPNADAIELAQAGGWLCCICGVAYQQATGKGVDLALIGWGDLLLIQGAIGGLFLLLLLANALLPAAVRNSEKEGDMPPAIERNDDSICDKCIFFDPDETPQILVEGIVYTIPLPSLSMGPIS